MAEDQHEERPGHGATPDGQDAPGESEEARTAAEAVERAREELRKAREAYRKVRRGASERLKQVREQPLGELVESGLEFVRKNPGPGVLIAALVGFFLGRLFRR